MFLILKLQVMLDIFSAKIQRNKQLQEESTANEFLYRNNFK